MGKLKAKNKNQKSKLTAEEKKLGRTDLYILIGMIVVGLALGLYFMQ